MTQQEIITFLKGDKHLKIWWESNEKNYTMDVPMMFVGRIKELLTITEQSRQAAVSGSLPPLEINPDGYVEGGNDH